MKTGILGGTFNPVHNGHLIIAEQAKELLDLDKVIFVPCYLPPHKSSKGIIPAQYRLEMVREAIKGNDSFEASDIETKAQVKSYTVETLRQLKGKFPKKIFFLIVGSDAIEELPKWRDFRKIVELAKIVIAPRAGFPVKAPAFPAKIINITKTDISSSDIRGRLMSGLSIRYMVPKKIEEYIYKKKLYLKRNCAA